MTAFGAYCVAYELGRYSGKADVGIVVSPVGFMGTRLLSLTLKGHP